MTHWISIFIKPDVLEEAENILGSPSASGSIQQVLDIVSERQEQVVGVVSSILLDITEDDDNDPLSREGIPNKLIQKLVRECHGIEVAMNIIRALFSKVCNFCQYMWHILCCVHDLLHQNMFVKMSSLVELSRILCH
jgi:hypothetical protein